MSTTQFVLDHDGNPFAGIVPAPTASVQITPTKQSRARPAEARSAFRVTVQRLSNPAQPLSPRLAFEDIVPSEPIAAESDQLAQPAQPASQTNQDNDPIQHSYMRVEASRSLPYFSFLDGPSGDIIAWGSSLLLIFSTFMIFPTTALNVSFTIGTNKLFPLFMSTHIMSFICFAYWFKRHLETKVLLRNALLTFEAIYLCLFAFLFVFATCFQFGPEYYTRGLPIDMEYTTYIVSRIFGQLMFVLIFVSCLCCDALINVSVAIKFWVHLLFLAFTFFTWWSALRSNASVEVSTEFCLGSTVLSCFSTHSMRVTPLAAISVFFLRNIVHMARHYLWPAVDGASQKLMMIKSNVSFVSNTLVDAPDSQPVSEEKSNTLEPTSEVFEPGAAKHETSIDSASQEQVEDHRDSIQQTLELASAMKLLDMEEFEHDRVVQPVVELGPFSVPGCVDQSDAQPQPALSIQITTVHNEPIIQSRQPIVADVQQPVSEIIRQETRVLHLMSAFSKDFDTAPHERRMMLGEMMYSLWQKPIFQVACHILFLTTAAFCFSGEPRTPMISLIVWLCVILCTIFIASLAEVRLLTSLCKTFEFWLLQVVNIFSLVATCYNAFALNEAWANYTHRAPSVQLQSDLVWMTVGFLGNILISCFDALLVDQRVKLSLGIFWMLNLTRLMLWYIFELDSRPQTTTESVHWCVLSFCSTPNVIIIQAALTFAVFCLKFNISMLRFPKSLVILRSPVYLSAQLDGDNE